MNAPDPRSAAPSDPHAPPPGAGFMNTLRWVLFAGLLVLAVASVASYVASRWPRSESGRAAARTVYQCPMHPSYTSDRPGECPICGMTLERVTLAGATTHAHDTSDVPGLVSVHIDPDRVQLIGVRTAIVTSSPIGGRLELVGVVAPDEARLSRVQVRAAGWIQHLYVSRTGEMVKRGDPLLEIYSPELYQSEREYLIERSARDTAGASPHGASHESGTLAAGRWRLHLLGVPDGEIARLDREGSVVTALTLRSPVDGTVLERGAVEGQYAAAETPLFTVADLSRVWVLADLYEMDYDRVRTGDPARFSADAMPGRGFAGQVEFVYPTVSGETRTLKLRMALDNPDGRLRPGMFGRVSVTGRTARALVVPDEAVINTGEESYVFLAHAGGRFEPRRVTVGVRDGDRLAILSGVAAGDTVVASASFLIDSESRLKAAIEGLAAPAAPAAPSAPHTGHGGGGRP